MRRLNDGDGLQRWILVQPLLSGRGRRNKKGGVVVLVGRAGRGGGGGRAVQAGFTWLKECHGYPPGVCHSAPTRIDRDGDTQTQALPRTLVRLRKRRPSAIAICP